jgi:hypothetical protein|tara:strand:+ start:397 stop:606 length:210 start_codon:yes stop_codon:yes gene_type:complete
MSEYTLDDAAEEIQALTINAIFDLIPDFNMSLNDIIEELASNRFEDHQNGLIDAYVDNQIKSRKEDSYE